MNGIGQTLKEAREKKGLTLDDLQQTTKIQKRYLIAIEAENFDALPGDFYVRAFIQQYAKVVDLDGDELLAQLEEKTGIKTETPVAHETTTRTEAVRIEQAEKNDFLGKLMNYLPTIIIVIVVVAILGTIYVVAWGNHSKNTESQSSSSQTVSVSSDVKKKKSSASTSSAKKTTSSKTPSAKKKSAASNKQTIENVSSEGSKFVYDVKNAADKNKLELSVSGSAAWSAVSSNGSQVWQGTLNDGGSHTVELPESTTTITISLGNSNSTSLKLNGKKFDYKKENDTLTVRTITLNLK
ncbi:helix-turn-helix domain-containing protein [Ligilactobacillus ruminis]|uniref:helix-turn-helix domain-containing protein n=1 Tax=Ligilactobacillus ruminis TaxID=1623 RepID=UPI00265B1B6C|nr:RodZ domain-containing protein [Ligilactobacillus ruminis]WKB70023.1 DUF4115 domain-containing protein [Ligilactobacillus ruminis]